MHPLLFPEHSLVAIESLSSPKWTPNLGSLQDPVRNQSIQSKREPTPRNEVIAVTHG